MAIETPEIQTLLVIVVLLIVLYIWIRQTQQKNKLEKERKLRCKELILDNRIALASAGIDFEGLISLVSMQISSDQLERVIDLLIAKRKLYNIDAPDEPGSLEVDLDFDAKGEKDKEVARKGVGGKVESGEQKTEIAGIMDAEQEKAWIKMAHNRYRVAVSEKCITEKQAKLKFLVKMVELGKKGVADDRSKAVARKEYEISLWDRFYEDEYLELSAG